MKRRLASLGALFTVSAACFLLLGLSEAIAQTPSLINYQGRLTDVGGEPLDGSYNIGFAIYDVSSGGVPLWTESHAGVVVSEGLLSVLLGSVVSFPGDLFNDNDSLFLGISVNADPEMLPRFRISRTPFADRVGTIDGASGGTISSTVEISTDPFTTPLQVSGGGGNAALIVGGSTFQLILNAENIQSEISGNPNLAVLDIQRDGGEVRLGDNGLVLNSDKSIGIGTLIPIAKLHVRGSSVPILTSALQSETIFVEDEDAILGLYSDGSGVAGSGITLGEARDNLSFSKWSIIRGTDAGGNGLRFAYGVDANPYSNTTHLFIESGGDVGLGTLAPNYKLDVRGSIGSNATLYHSDKRWKKSIRALNNSLDLVSQLRGVTFRWKQKEYSEMNFSDGEHIGLIAQEVEAVLPQLVNTNAEGFKSVEYANLVAVLVEAVKQLKSENSLQRDTIARLITRIEAIECELEEVRSTTIVTKGGTYESR